MASQSEKEVNIIDLDNLSFTPDRYVLLTDDNGATGRARGSTLLDQVQTQVEQDGYVAELLLQMEEAVEDAKVYSDGVEVEGGYNAVTHVPTLTASSAAAEDKEFYRVYGSAASVFAFTNYPSGTTLSDGDKIRKDGEGWFLDKFVQRLNTRAVWVGPEKVTFDFTARTISVPNTGFWVIDNVWYNNNLVFKGSTAGAVKTITIPASINSFGLNFLFFNLNTQLYYCINYVNIGTVPVNSYLVATWHNPEGAELSYYTPSIFALKATTYTKAEVDAFGFATTANTYTKAQINNFDQWLTWQYDTDVVFDFTAKTITIPGGYWVKDKIYYNNTLTPNAGNGGTSPIVVNMSVANSGFGVNYLFADLVGKAYYALNQTQLAGSPPPAGSALIATWYNPTGDALVFRGKKASLTRTGEIALASASDRTTGTDALKAITAVTLRAESDDIRSAALVANWIGSSPIVFDFTAQTITMPAGGFWSKSNKYYSNLLVLDSSSAGARVVNMPGSGASFGINYFFADFTTATYYCINYPTRATIPRTATLIATWFNPTGDGLSYVNTSLFATAANTYTKAQIDAIMVGFNETNNRLISAAKLFMIDGVPLPLYKSSVTSSVAGLSSYKLALIEKDNGNNNAPRYRYMHEDLVIDSATLKPSVALGMAQTGNLKTYTQALAIARVTQASLVGKSPKVMLIGDSLTNRNSPFQVKTQLAKYGATPTMVGTMDNLGGEKGEGREGWEWENFIGKDTLYSTGATVLPVDYSNPSTYLKNPFMKLATTQDKTDHPDWCFRNTGATEELTYTSDPVKTGNFYIFDFTNYLAQTGVAAPDVVVLNLWTNDQLQDAVSAGVVQSLLAMEIMIRQIKTALPSVKIGIAAAPVRGITAAGNTGWYDNCTWIENCIQKIKTLSATLTNLEIVPIWMHTNRDFNFPVTSSSLSALNDTQINTISDPVHWNTEGTIENAVVIASYIANVV